MYPCCINHICRTYFIHYFFISYKASKNGVVHRKSFLKFVYSKFNQVKNIVISKGTELLRVPVDRLMYVTSDGNYSNVVTQDGYTQLVSLQLGQIEDLLNDQLGDSESRFLRLGKSLIINMDYIYFIDVAKKQLILSDCSGSRHELSASREVLIKLKAYAEALINTDND